MPYFYQNLELENGETIEGFMPYPTTLKTKSGLRRITFQVGTKRYNVYVSSVFANKIDSLDPHISQDDIVVASGSKGGIRLKLVERDGWRRAREKLLPD